MRSREEDHLSYLPHTLNVCMGKRGSRDTCGLKVFQVRSLSPNLFLKTLKLPLLSFSRTANSRPSTYLPYSLYLLVTLSLNLTFPCSPVTAHTSCACPRNKHVYRYGIFIYLG